MMTRFVLATAATVFTLATGFALTLAPLDANAGPSGRDFERYVAGPYQAPRALPRSMNADAVYFDTRQDRDFEGSGGKSTCYKIVAVDRRTGEEQVLNKCLSGDQKEINQVIESYEQAAQSARANGSSSVTMRGHEFDQAESDRDRSRRHREEFR